MARFRKILSFLKGSKKRKSVVIHDSRVIRNEVQKGGHIENGNRKYDGTTDRPATGNGKHYEQFLYVDDDKNGGQKRRTLSVVPSVVSSSNYTQTEPEFSDTFSHLHSDKINGKPLNRISSGNHTMNKSINSIRKLNKPFIIRQDPIEEEKIIVEVTDNDKEEIEIDEDELIGAVQEFENEKKRSSGVIVNSNIADQSTFIIKEDKEDENGNQSFIIKNVNEDVYSKRLSFIISSNKKPGFGGLEDVEEENEEDLISGETYHPVASPEFNGNIKTDDHADTVKMKNSKKNMMIQPGEEKEVESNQVMSTINNKKKVAFVDNKEKVSKSPVPLFKKLNSRISSPKIHNATKINPMPIYASSTLPKFSNINKAPLTNDFEERFTTLSSKNSFNYKSSTNTNVLKPKTSDKYIPTLQNRNEITEMKESMKHSNSYKSAIPVSKSENIFFMPLPRPSQATLLDFGGSIKNSPLLAAKKTNLYSQSNHSHSNFQPMTKRPWNDSIFASQVKEGIHYSAPLKPSVPIIKENPQSLHTSNSIKNGSNYRLRNNPSTKSLFSATSVYAEKYKKDKPVQNLQNLQNLQTTPSPYSMDRVETPSAFNYVSDHPIEENFGMYKEKPYVISPNISVEIENDEILDRQSDSSITSNTEDDSFVYNNYRRISRNREESLRNVRAYVDSLDEIHDTDSIFSTPLAYRKKYEKYGSLKSRTSSIKSQHNRKNSYSTIGSLKTKALKSKKSSQSSNTEFVEGSSLTEYSNSNNSETASSYSFKTNSTNRTAPTQNSIYSREYYLSTKKYNNNLLPVSSIQKYRNSGENLNTNYGDMKRKEKFNSDSTIISAYHKKYNYKSTTANQGNHKNHSSVSSGSTLACSPLAGPRSLLNNNNNINKFSIMTAESNNYFDDFMKDLHDMSLNDLVTKYDQVTN